MRCPHCSSEDTVRHGRRRTVNGPVQVHLCKDCGRTSTDRPIRYLNTRPILVLRGVSLYNQGYSLGQCSKMLKEAFDEKVPRNTIHYWTTHYRDVFPYLDMRRKDEPRLPLVTRRLDDFVFSYHKRKVMAVSGHLGTLKELIVGAGRAPKVRSPPIRSAPPQEWTGPFIAEGQAESRIASLVEDGSENDVLRAVLINDAFTLCRNLPLVLEGDQDPPTYDPIPLLQVRNGKVRLLAFRPGADGPEGPLGELLPKALALSEVTGIPLRDLEVGWFDARRSVHCKLLPEKTL